MESAPASGRLGERLRALRLEAKATQRQVADAVGVSAAQVSSWEKGNAQPPSERLEQLSALFATARSFESDTPRIHGDLTPEEQGARRELQAELTGLRETGLQRAVASPATVGQLGGRFWHFPDRQQVTIICTALSRRQLLGDDAAAELGDRAVPDTSYPPAQQYALNPRHPNAVPSLANGDAGALLELVGHIRAENPTTHVRWRRDNEPDVANHLLGHVVILGGGDPGASRKDHALLLQRLDIPVTGRAASDTEEFDLWYEVQDGEGNVEFYPEFVSDTTEAGVAPELRSDVALIARRPNPFNESATVTQCSGLFSRGTLGAVRAFTEPTMRARNESFLDRRVSDPGNFWMLVQVPSHGVRTMPPDLGNDDHVLHVG